MTEKTDNPWHYVITAVVTAVLVSLFFIALAPTTNTTYRYVFNTTYNLSCPGTECRCPITACAPCYRPIFVREAEITHDLNSYDLKDYNCNEFSDDLLKRLKNDGYAAKKCYGFYDGQGHAWIEINSIWIESTTGKVIEASDRSKHYSLNYCL